MAFAGEELGHQGSRFYCRKPLFPLKKTVLNINFELLGRPEGLGKMRFYITGISHSNLADKVRAYNRTHTWALVDTLEIAEHLFFASDNRSFATIDRKDDWFYGIPAHTFAIETLGDHVHKPWDEPEFIDHENLTAFIHYMAGFTIHAAKDAAPVQWTGSPFRPLQ